MISRLPLLLLLLLPPPPPPLLAAATAATCCCAAPFETEPASHHAIGVSPAVPHPSQRVRIACGEIHSTPAYGGG